MYIQWNVTKNDSNIENQIISFLSFDYITNEKI